MLPDTASPSHVCFIPHAKLNLLSVFLGPAELLSPGEVAIPKAKTWALIDGSAVLFHPAGLCSWALQPRSDPFSFHGVPVVHAHSQRLLSVSTLLYNFFFCECHQVSRTSSRHVCTARCGVLASWA